MNRAQGAVEAAAAPWWPLLGATVVAVAAFYESMLPAPTWASIVLRSFKSSAPRCFLADSCPSRYHRWHVSRSWRLPVSSHVPKTIMTVALRHIAVGVGAVTANAPALYRNACRAERAKWSFVILHWLEQNAISAVLSGLDIASDDMENIAEAHVQENDVLVAVVISKIPNDGAFSPSQSLDL